MRKLFAVLLACAMLLSASALAESPIFGIVTDSKIETAAEVAAPADPSFVFTFRDGITWDTTLEELKAIYPEHDFHETSNLDGEEKVLGYKAFTSLEVRDVPVGIFEADLLLGMIDGKLVMIAYEYIMMGSGNDAYYNQDERFEMLKKNLTAKYGEVAYEDWQALLAAIPEGMAREGLEEEAGYADEDCKFAAWRLPDNTIIYMCDAELYYVNYLAMDAQVESLIARIEAAQTAEADAKEKEINEGLQNAI